MIEQPPDFLVGSCGPHPANDNKRHRLYRMFWRLHSHLAPARFRHVHRLALAPCQKHKNSNCKILLKENEVCGISSQICCPNLLHETVHKHSDRSGTVRTTEVPDLAFTRAVTIHILILFTKSRKLAVKVLCMYAH